MQSIAGPARPWLLAGLLLAASTAVIGCANRSRPVISPVQPVGPAGTPPGGFALVLTQPAQRSAQSIANPCPASIPNPANPATNQKILYANAGVSTVIDFSGDSVVAQTTIGTGPLTSAIGPSTNEVYSLNCDGTVSGIPISAGLQQNQITTTTLTPGSTSTGTNGLPSPSIQGNILIQNSAIYVTNLGPGANGQYTVGALNTGSGIAAPSLLQQIPVAPALVALAGSPSSQRVYAISQGSNGSNVSWGQCGPLGAATLGVVPGNGQADGIDTATNAVSSRIPVGNCPVFGLTTPDGLRTFILNRGSGTISVINDQQDALDTSAILTANTGVPGTIKVGAGPVYAAYFAQRSLLVTANYDSGTVSFINVPLDNLDNDAPGFGQVLGTAQVGAFPAALTILGDGSRVYVALQGDPTNPSAAGAIAIVNMTSFTLQGAPIAVPGHPRVIASTYNDPVGKVYVVAPDSSLLTILRTDTDQVSAQLQLQGCGVDVRTNYQYVGQTNLGGPAVSANTFINGSNGPGSGAPTLDYTQAGTPSCQ